MKLITLDWEGTLVDFQWNLDEAVAETVDRLQEKNAPESFAGMDYAAIYNTVEKRETGWGYDDGSLLSLVDEIYDRYDLDAASRWQLSEGLEVTLAALRNYKLALVTNVGRKGIEVMLDKYDLGNLFGLVLTRNEVRCLKPHPGGIVKAMEWAGVTKDETLHVGDSLSDVFAARNAGVKIGVVLGGQHSAATLLKEKPDLVLEKLNYLPARLDELL